MPRILSDSERSFFGSGILDHFDEFSRSICIFKEPRKTVVSTSTNVFAGYGNQSSSNNVTYTPQSGVYPAVITYKQNQSQTPLAELKASFPAQVVTIKVQESGRNYIINGKTERIVVDGLNYNLSNRTWVQNFGNQTFYYFELDSTN